MANPFSIASGSLSMTGLLGNCVDYFDYIQFGQHFGQDYQMSQLMLDVAKNRLLRWGQMVNIDENGIVGIPPETSDQAREILEHICLLFEAAQKKSKRYESKARSEPRSKELVVFNPTPIDGVFAHLHQRMKEIAIQRLKRTTLFKKATWELYDKKSFGQLVTQFVELNRELETLPSIPKIDMLLESELAEVSDEASLHALRDAASETDEAMAAAVHHKLEQISSHNIGSPKTSDREWLGIGDYHGQSAMAQGSSLVPQHQLITPLTTQSQFFRSDRDHLYQNEDTSCVSNRAAAVRNLARLLTPLLIDEAALQTSSCREILSAIQAMVPTLIPNNPIFATFHDGQVHDPLGGGSYAFQDDVIEPILLALINDEIILNGEKRSLFDKSSNATSPKNCPATPHRSGEGLTIQLPTRPTVIHAGVQPNNSPHAGTLVVFCYAFSLARRIRDRMQAMVVNTNRKPPSVSVEITFVDTAPVKDQGAEIGGIQYQRSYRDVPGALETHMADYEEVLHLLSTWSAISFTTAFQSDFFSHPTIPLLLRYIITHRVLLGQQLSPKYGTLALRAACPTPGCGLAEKHGLLNVYNDNSQHQKNNASSDGHDSHDATITFHCPHHGPHTICISEPADVARLEANAPARNLIRSMSHLLDTSTHHVRMTGADYAGMYQEVFLYRPLAAWSAATGLAAGRTPHILYAPLIVDWSGAKLSKALYVRKGGYEAMKLFGTEGLCSFARLKSQFGGDGAEGLRRIWEEVGAWVGNPKKLFRSISVDYLQRVITRCENCVVE